MFTIAQVAASTDAQPYCFNCCSKLCPGDGGKPALYYAANFCKTRGDLAYFYHRPRSNAKRAWPRARAKPRAVAKERHRHVCLDVASALTGFHARRFGGKP